MTKKDVIVMNSGNLACRFLEVSAAKCDLIKFVVMTNVDDNLSRFTTIADAILYLGHVPTSLARKYPSLNIVDFFNEPELFSWQKDSNDLATAETDIIKYIDELPIVNGVIIAANVRLSSSDIDKYLSILDDLEVTDVVMIFIGVNEVITNNKNVFTLKWCDDLHRFFKKLHRFPAILLNLFSGGANTTINALLSDVVCIAPETSDVASFLSPKLLFNDEIVIPELISTLLDNKDFYASLLEDSKRNQRFFRELNMKNLSFILDRK